MWTWDTGNSESAQQVALLQSSVVLRCVTLCYVVLRCVTLYPPQSNNLRNSVTHLTQQCDMLALRHAHHQKHPAASARGRGQESVPTRPARSSTSTVATTLPVHVTSRCTPGKHREDLLHVNGSRARKSIVPTSRGIYECIKAPLRVIWSVNEGLTEETRRRTT